MKIQEYNIDRELLKHFRYKGNELYKVTVVIQDNEITQLKILPLIPIHPSAIERVIK